MQSSDSVSREGDDAPVHSMVNLLDTTDAVNVSSSFPVIRIQSAPEDILQEIVSCMPAKAAIKYYSHYKIRLSPHVIQKQCTRSCDRESGFFLLDKSNNRTEGEFHILPWETSSAFGIPNNLIYSRFILSSSNGLLLCRSLVPCGSYNSYSIDYGTYNLYVRNPATRKEAQLPIPKGVYPIVDNERYSPLIECYPWGHGVLDNVEFPNDYTVVLPVYAQQCFDHDTYTSVVYLAIHSQGRWVKEIFVVDMMVNRGVRYDMPVGIFSNAAKGLIVHYMCDTISLWNIPDLEEPYIAAISIGEKKLLRKIELPKGAWDMEIAKMYGPSDQKMLIFKWNEKSICLVRWWFGHSKMVAWVLDNYGCEGESWRLVMDASERDLCPDEGACIMSVGVTGGGRGLLIATAPAKPPCKEGGSSTATGVVASEPASSRGDVLSRLYVYVVEGNNQGRLELVGEYHIKLQPKPSSYGALRFMPYANTLRPVSVEKSETYTTYV